MENVIHCRLCADVVSGEYKYIFSPEEDLSERINSCLPIQVKKTDPLPKQVCKICLQTFDQYQNFYFQVLHAEKKLKTTWRQTNVSKKRSGQCIDCPLCSDGSIGIKDGRIILGGAVKNNCQTKSLGHVDNECLAQMIRQELEQEDLKRLEKSSEIVKSVNYEYVCFTCGEGFITEEEISKHNCITQPDAEKKEEDKTDEKKKNPAKLNNESEEVPAQCEVCGKKYKNLKRLNDHLSFCHPLVYHKCEFCEKQFPKKWLLTTHMRKHTGELPYKCTKCSKGFISNSHLRNHINFHHKERNLECNVCRATGFYTKQDLENHIRTKHTKERIFHCNVCNKSFMSSGVYYQHRLIHTDIRKYPCTYCDKTFRRWLALHNHIRIHKGERPFPCELCGRAFRQRGDMKKHLATQHCKKT